MKNVIVITGPTGVGKTKLSIELAKKYDGEIINADAMQVYKDLNIGTAKIREEEKEGIIHHLFDVKDVNEEYSIYDYQKDCRMKLEEIWNNGKLPIIVGGTGLYIKSALYDYKLDKKKENREDYENVSTEELYKQLIEMDSKAFGNIDANNRRRIVNAINYYKDTGKSIIENKTDVLLYDALFIGLTTDRDKLYKIINKRVDKMIGEGLVQEVQTFYQRGIFTKPLIGGIGYKELYDYFDENISLEEAIELIKRNSRRYAKRQYTFFNHQLPVKWFNTDYDNFDNTVREVCNYIDKTIHL